MIASLVVLQACLGVLLLLLLFARIRALGSKTALTHHRGNEPGLSDLLIYAAVVEDGVILGKDGSLMAAWVYQGNDTASSTEEEREFTSLRINQALARLGSGWMIHVDAVRRPAEGYPVKELSSFPDPVSAAIDAERRALFESIGTLYESHFILVVTYLPPILAQRKFVELMFDDDEAPTDQKGRTLNLLKYFQNQCLSIETQLSSVLKLSRLKGNKVLTEDNTFVTQDEFLQWLQFCITGMDHPVVLPRNPVYLDTLLGGQELWTGVIPKIGRHYIQVVAIEGFPMESTPGMLNILTELPSVYRWSTRFIFLDPHEAVTYLEKFRSKWKQKIRGFFDQVFNLNSHVIDADALSMVEDAQAAIAETNSGVVGQGFYTSVVVLMDESRERLETTARQVEKAINHLGFAARVETINTVDAYLGSLPGHGVENVRRPLINTMNLADLLPGNTLWTGIDQAPCPMYPPNSPPLMHCITQGATPFRLNLHVRDIGHTLMFGPTGAGKSTHLAMIAAQLRRYKNMAIYVFDKGLSMYPMAKAVGGKHFMIAGDSDSLAFCPLQFLETKSDRAWALEWLCTLIELNHIDITPSQRNEINLALNNMYASGARTLSEFLITIQDTTIREALTQYTIDGAMGHLLDAEHDGLSLSDFTVFEIEELMNLGDQYALPVLLYLFRRIERDLRGQPAAIILDEAWIMLGHPVFRAKIREWLKVLRKANCLVLMATQNLSDAVNSGILDVMVESTSTKLFLPNVFARDEDTAALYRRLGLNDRQIDILATAEPKRQYYYVSEYGRRLYDLALGPIALAFVGASDKESIATIRDLIARYGEGWIDQWLAIKGLPPLYQGKAT
ncbi:VirB4 family type IV secretion/conjugal transfer ATPase [Nitrosomonas sp. Is37]|uniref:VirB4 family type IV secretion/conjugal transfer ATPase n=1 Tax=Nitrosomonas sp. Is37 TaxID=3080535 RepID=UPI00294B25F2|nr:VirB4 family type IV secretion/conjugal transfer ATPase [Nitrosomonas sp. Is37]MDV6344796.1 VirB4 family type IV secretion/conjugal transfer ATPase [Nitrosomonas sp. Is37]